MVENHLFQLLVDFLLFSQNHVSFSLNGRGFQLRVLEDVGQDIDRLGNVGIEGLGIVDGILTLGDGLASGCIPRPARTNRGVSVEVSSHVFNLELELVLAASSSTLYRSAAMSKITLFVSLAYLESQMLQEMSCAVGLVGFASAAGVDPHSHGRGLGPW
jgi:hypothetical protein